tara:strand:+ start:156 stop:590 length:435 start_codon:yes stop_codon:yes gene_type:complete
LHPSKLIFFCKIFLSIVAMNIVLANEERSMENRDPKKAFYFSLIPGMGQLYNGKLIKSAIIIGLEVSAYAAWKENSGKYNNYDNNNYQLKKHRYLEKRNKYAWWIGILYFYAMIDAVVDAHLNSFDTLMESPLNKEKKQGEENE